MGLPQEWDGRQRNAKCQVSTHQVSGPGVDYAKAARGASHIQLVGVIGIMYCTLWAILAPHCLLNGSKLVWLYVERK